jgi:hypothetical protein
MIEHESIWIFKIQQKQRIWRKKWVRGWWWCICGCYLSEPIRNTKSFRYFYISKQVLKKNLVLFIWQCKNTTDLISNTHLLGSQTRLWNTRYLIFVYLEQPKKKWKESSRLLPQLYERVYSFYQPNTKINEYPGTLFVISLYSYKTCMLLLCSSSINCQ